MKIKEMKYSILEIKEAIDEVLRSYNSERKLTARLNDLRKLELISYTNRKLSYRKRKYGLTEKGKEMYEKVNIKKIILTLYSPPYIAHTINKMRKVEVECNRLTAKKLFEGVKPYQFPDGTTGYLFPCRDCKEVTIEYRDGKIERQERRGCPYLTLREEKEIFSGAYSKFEITKSVVYQCELYRLERERKLM